MSDAVARALAAHIPRYIASEVSSAELGDLASRPLRREGAVLFCDISGFTPLSEALGRHGKEGTEALTSVLNDYFDLLIGVLQAWGGDVVKFGGDAVTVLFEPVGDESLAGAFRRACACSLDIFDTLGGTREAKTPWGTFQLSLKVGASAGSALAGVLGDPAQRLEHILAGEALDRMADAEHHARPGWAVVDRRLPFLGEAGLVLEPLPGDFARLVSLSIPSAQPAPRPQATPSPQALRPFLLPSVWGQVEAGTAALLSEHRSVATVFVAFPGLDYGEDASLSKLDAYFRRVNQLLQGYGGAFNRMDMGDKGSKFLCFFGAPVSYENNEERAVAFTLALRGLEKELPWLGAQRAGISVGTAYCGVMGSRDRQEYTVMGDAVNVAARLMGSAGDDGILATEEVRQATSDKFRWGPYRELTVKGKSAPLKVSTPVAFQRRKQPRALQPQLGFVGRKAELELLQGSLRRAGKSSAPQPLVIVGESGMGKTALLEVFLAKAHGSGAASALGTCPPVAPAPFQPWVQAFGALLSEGGKGRDAIEGAWLRLLPDQREFIGLGLDFLGYAAPLSPQALSLGPQERQEKVVDLLARTLRALSERRPVVLALDDLHAADPGTLRLLADLPPRMAGCPILILGATRPGFQPPLKTREIPLGGFGSEEVRDFSLAYLKARRVPEDLLRTLASRSAGNPLFLIEVLQILVDSGTVARDRDGRVNWDASRSLSLPGSVEGLLLARMDRLPLDMRNTLKVASCLGPSFGLELLRSVFRPPTPAEELSGRLEALQSMGLKRGEGDHASTYTFSHASLREAAYDSVLLANRRTIHAAAGETLEALGEGERNPALLAFHFGAAEAWDRAIPYGLGAAKSFMERYDFATALDQYTQVESWALRAGVPLRATDLLDMAECAVTCAGYGGALELLGRVQESPGLSQADRFRAGGLLLRILEATGEYEECLRQAQHLSDEAMELGLTPELLEVSRYVVSCQIRLGRLQDAEASLAPAIDRVGEAGGGAPEGPLRILQAAIPFQRGDFREAIRHYREALNWALTRGHYLTEVQAHLGMANALRETGKLRESAESSELALDRAKAMGSRINILGAAVTLATALNWLQEPHRALEILEEVQPGIGQGQSPYAICQFWNQMGVTWFFLGNHAKALGFYRRCRLAGRRNKIPEWVALSTYNIADALAALGLDLKAQAEYRKAMRLFREGENAPAFLQASKDLLALVRRGGDPEQERRFEASLRKLVSGWGKPELFDQVIS